MEQENTQPSNGIDDATRLTTSTHMLTLTPLSDTVTADEDSDDLIAARHVLAPPIANIPSDEEITRPKSVQEVATEKKNHRRASVASITAVIILTIATAYLVLTQ